MLLVTIDPIGTLVLFIPLTAGLPAADRPRIARKAVFVAGGVLLLFLIAGEFALSQLGIRLVSFQIAGGVILFLFALQMVFGTGVMAHTRESEPGHDVAVFPLALPGIANTGAILAVVLLTENNRHSIVQQVSTAAASLAVLALTLLILLAAQPLHRWLGMTGSNVLIRVLGLVLAALATEQIAVGLESLFSRTAG